MSRSYRKNLVLTDVSTNHRYQPSRKQIASRVTRRKIKASLRRDILDDIDSVTVTQNGAFRKLYSSYDIIDFRVRFHPSITDVPKYKWLTK